MSKNHLTKSELTSELISLAKIHGGLNERIINNFATFSRRTVRTHFQSISKACLELKLPQLRMQCKSRKGIPRIQYTQEEIAIQIKHIETKYGYFSKGLIDVGGLEYGRLNHKVITRIWGSFTNMYKALKIKSRPNTKGAILISDDFYLSKLKEFSLSNNLKSFNSILLNKFCVEQSIAYATIYRRFGKIADIAKLLNLPWKSQWQNELSAIDLIANILNDHNYIKQYRHDYIKDKLRFPIDAFWPKFKLCLEYNGIQHYQHNRHFHKTKSDFIRAQRRDELKYKLIQELNFKLLIIKYNDSKEDIINNLSLLNLQTSFLQ
jgi:hypothetical protein